ncbi:MAG: hypothetical protein QME52_07125, partial [Bacteroidota bacterium]|nr:hypothetical protein [Bacteroidota bacterium]
GTNNAIIGRGVTLIKDGAFGVNDTINALMIDSGGVVTHSQRLLAGMQLDVVGTLEIKSGGMIDVNGKGLLGGRPGGLFGKSGETYGSGDTIVAGAGSGHNGAGGSYGGQGGDASGATSATSSSPYGLMEEPRHLGSGGGADYFNDKAGGNGGGRVTIAAGVCVLDGTIRANGGNGVGVNPQSGGGSGGGIWMNVGSLSGTGSIRSIGGKGLPQPGYNSGSGGGGRIAIYYGTMTLPVTNISARGGSGGNSASAGTIYLKDNTQSLGSVIVDNANISCQLYTPWRSGLSSIRSLTVNRAGKLEVGTEVNIEGPILVTGGGKIGRP